MKLNQNSISARLYRWFYLTDSMPTNLCPYFWKLVLMYTLLTPTTILYLPLFVIKNESTEQGERIAISFFSWILVFGAFLMIFPITYFFYGWFPDDSYFGSFQTIGIILWIGASLIGVTFGIVHFINKRRENKLRKTYKYIWDEFGDYVPNPNYVPYEPKPNILVEFIKASYHKYCPKIDWK